LHTQVVFYFIQTSLCITLTDLKLHGRLKRMTKKKKTASFKRTPFIPFTNVSHREQWLIIVLGITVIFATVYFAGADTSIASIAN